MKLQLLVCLALAVVCAALHSDLSRGHSSLEALRETVHGSLTINLNNADNVKTCRTEKYRTKSLVVRRGSKILLTISGGRPTKLTLGLLIRDKMPMTKKLRDSLALPIGGAASNGATVKNVGGDKYELVLDAKFPVGEYEVSADGGGSSGKATTSMFVVFNPYSPEDSVFCKSDSTDTKGKACDLAEYVEAESGLIWVGSSDNNGPRGWNYDQFNEKALDTVMAAISPLSLADRSDPIKVSRRLSDIMNTERAGDGGILEGNWSGDYSGGKEPGFWTGSIAIFEEFLKSGRAVKFGQCWVFAGITCTAGRAIGLPTRAVTNFDSAHECRRNGKFDQVVTEYWKSLPGGKWQREEGKTCDSIWNFHVWNEGFFLRPDLKSVDYNGWQAFDGTPQEESEGKFQTGPASVKACHDKKVDLKYDTDFIAGETNADVERYVDGKLYHTDTWHVGAKTYTKAVRRSSFLNVAPLYKSESKNRFRFLSTAASDNGLEFSIFVPKSTKRVGDDFYVHLEFKKIGSNAPSKIKVAIIAEAIEYRGKPIAQIAEITKEVDVTEKGKVILEIKAADYLKHVKRSHSFGFAFFAASGSNTIFVERAQIDLEVPRLNMLGRTELFTGSKISVPIKFTNPLKEDIQVLDLNYAITGADNADKSISEVFGKPLNFPLTLKAGEAKMWHISVTGATVGDVIIAATLSTDKITDVFGYKEVTVKESVRNK